MKKIFTLLLLLAMCSLYACGDKTEDTDNKSDTAADVAEVPDGKFNGGDEKTEVFPAKVGDVLDAPEKTATLEGVTEVTVKVSRSFESVGDIEMSASDKWQYSLKRSGNGDKHMMLRYADEKMENVFGNYMYGKDGKEEWYEFRSADLYPSVTEMSYVPYDESAIKSGTEYIENAFAYFGFDYEPQMENAKFTKKADVEFGGKSCYAYDVVLTDQLDGNKYSMELYVDKDTGIWVWRAVDVSCADGFPEGAKQISVVDSVEYSYSGVSAIEETHIEKTEIYNDGKIIITATELDCRNENLGASLLLECQNNSENDILFETDYFCVNGLCLGEKVASLIFEKGNAKSSIEIPYLAMELSDVDIIDTLDFSFTLREITKHTNEGDLYGDNIAENVKVLIDTDCPDDFVQKVNKEGDVIIDNADFLLVLTDIIPQSNGAMAVLHCENRTDKTIRAYLYIKSINGIETDDYISVNIPAAKYGCDGGIIYTADANDVPIPLENINNLEYTYEVYRLDGDFYSQRKLIHNQPEKQTITFKE